MVLMMSTLGACSFLTVTAPKLSSAGTRMSADDCTEFYGPPVVDTLATGALTWGGVSMLTRDYTPGPFSFDTRGIAAGLFLVPAALFLASTVYGYANVHACRSPVEAPSATASATPPQAPVAPEPLPARLPLTSPVPRVQH